MQASVCGGQWIKILNAPEEIVILKLWKLYEFNQMWSASNFIKRKYLINGPSEPCNQSSTTRSDHGHIHGTMMSRLLHNNHNIMKIV
jgi:hypothetical protein